MGKALECEGLTHEKYNVDEQIRKYVDDGGEILACVTCLKSRQLDSTEVCPLSTMVDCVNVVIRVYKMVPFWKDSGKVLLDLNSSNHEPHQ